MEDLGAAAVHWPGGCGTIYNRLGVADMLGISSARTLVAGGAEDGRHLRMYASNPNPVFVGTDTLSKLDAYLHAAPAFSATLLVFKN